MNLNVILHVLFDNLSFAKSFYQLIFPKIIRFMLIQYWIKKCTFGIKNISTCLLMIF